MRVAHMNIRAHCKCPVHYKKYKINLRVCTLQLLIQNMRKVPCKSRMVLRTLVPLAYCKLLTVDCMMTEKNYKTMMACCTTEKESYTTKMGGYKRARVDYMMQMVDFHMFLLVDFHTYLLLRILKLVLFLAFCTKGLERCT